MNLSLESGGYIKLYEKDIKFDDAETFGLGEKAFVRVMADVR